MKDYREMIKRNAAQLCELKSRIDETLRATPHGPEHHAACAEFHYRYDSLAFPFGLSQAMESIKAGDLNIIEIAIQYLEVKPRFFGSGYIAEEILHRLKRLQLTPDQITRLVSLIIQSIVSNDGRTFIQYVHLAGFLLDVRILNAAKNLINDPRAYVRWRAQRMLDILKMDKSMRN